MNNLTGKRIIEDELLRFDAGYLAKKYLTLEDFDEALQNLEVGGTPITLPSFSKYSTDKPADSDINLNNQSITNLKQLSLTGGISAISSSALSIGLAALMFPNTGLQNITNKVSMGSKIVTNIENAELIDPNDDVLTTIGKMKQAANVATVNTLCITTSPDDRNNYTCGSKKINDLGDAVIYKDSDVRTKPDPIELNVFSIDNEKVASFQTQAVNVRTMQNACVTLEDINRAYFSSQDKQIKRGQQATEAKDYVTLDQVVHQEQAQMNWLESGTVESLPENQTSHFINETRVMFVPNPKAPVTGQFEAPTQPPSMISEEKQVANLKFVRKEANKKHDKNENIDLKNTYKVKNSLPPQEDGDCVTKGYCDSNSKNQDGTGALTGSILGTIGGLVGGGITSALFSTMGSGLSALGGISGSLAAGSALLQTGLQVGSGLDFDAVKPPGSSEGRLIDNLQDDIANGGQGYDNQQAQGGGQFQGPLQVSGMFSMARNAQVGLFDMLGV